MLPMRSISSQVLQPTSPTQISLVPGRTVKRKGLRKPSATIRRALGSELEKRGLPESPAPVAGSTRITEPFRPVGSPSEPQILRAQRSALGGRRRLDPSDAHRRIAAGVLRVAALPVVGPVEARAVAAARVEGSVGAEDDAADRMARVLLEPVVDEDQLRVRGHHRSGGRSAARAVRSRCSRRPSPPGGLGHGSERTPGVPHLGAGPPMSPS